MRRALALVALLVLPAAVAGCGDGGGAGPTISPTPTATPTAVATPEPSPAAREGLAIGITEQNANFIWPAERKPVPEPFARWRDRLQAMAPHRVRMILNWPVLQPASGAPANLEVAETGCVRAVEPCASYLGVREQLRALAAAQREHPGRWQAMVMITGTPEWAAAEPGPCEPVGTETRSRAVRDDALPAYRQLVEDVIAAARQEGADLRQWSAWNEPNHPYFLAPQRCGPDAPTLAVKPYVGLARTLQAALDAAPGDQELVLGELAGYVDAAPGRTTVDEFIAALPTDLVCASTIWSQHAYVEGPEGGPDAAGAALRALDRHACARPHEVWITETGVGAPRRGPDPLRGTRTECRAMHARLEHWYREPRVTSAFQYTLREDDLYPTGLVTTDLSRDYRVLDLWTAWAGEREPADPPPSGGC